MKVLHINAVAGTGSTGRLCDEISRRLAEVGDEGYIAYSVGEPGTARIRIGSRLDAKLHALGSRVTGMQGYFSSTATRRLIKKIAALQPDVVHLHNLHGNYINLGILLRYLYVENVPTVVTLHDCWFMTGKCTYYSRAECERWKDACGNCPLLRDDNPSWLFDRTKRMKRDKAGWLAAIPRLAIVGVSDWITEEAKESHLKSARVITRIYNWVDRDLFYPQMASDTREGLGITADEAMVLAVAPSWSERKGFGTLVELARSNPDMRFVIVGIVSSTEDLPGNVLPFGPVSDPSQLRRLYSAADVFVSLSEAETFGLVTAEALACGTPVVVVNSTASPELVAEGCGVVVESGDIEGMTRAIRGLVTAGKSAFSEGTVASVKNRFDRNAQVDEYIRLYRNLCSRNV